MMLMNDALDAGGRGGVDDVRVVAHHIPPIAVARDEEKSGEEVVSLFRIDTAVPR